MDSLRDGRSLAGMPSERSSDEVPRPSPTTSLLASHQPDASWRGRVVGRSLGPAADRAVERGQALISAATRLVQQSGEDFTMQQVAAEAGLSLRAIYQYFAGKDELLIALIEEAAGVLVRLIEQRIESYDEPLERLGAALYFMTDPRQHTDHDYNVTLFRFVARTWVSAPDQVGGARRPVTELLSRLIVDAAGSGAFECDDPESAAAYVALAHSSYQMNSNLGSSIGVPVPPNDRFVRFCLMGLGAQLPAGWEDRLAVTDSAADRWRRESERRAGTRVPLRSPETSPGSPPIR